MSLTLPPPGSTTRVLRHLRHIQPIPKGPGGKFKNRTQSHAVSNPKFVQPKDRIPYWNISPGDEVRVKVGGIKSVDPVTGEKKFLPYEGVVATVDRERNLVWLRAKEDGKDESSLPKNLKHVGARLREPSQGEAGGYTPNTAYVVRPIHYSNLQLRLPETTGIPKEYKEELDLKKGVYATRLTRTNVAYNAKAGHFVWKRFGIIPTAEGTLKLEIPWKSIEARDKVRKPHASSSKAVQGETWVPWDPSDPFKLLTARKETSEQAVHRIEKAMRQRAESLKDNADKAKSVAVSPALGRYAGFTKGRHVRMPLIPQAPSASEQLYQARQDVAEWLKDEEVEKHNNQGGRTFTAMDYIDSTPVEGPSDAHWHTIAAKEQSDDAWTRESSSDKLKQPLARQDMDSWPVELLMVNDLTNPTGLRNRMRVWNRKQAEKRDEVALKKAQDDEKVSILREKVRRDQQIADDLKTAASSVGVQKLEGISLGQDVVPDRSQTL